MRCNQPNNFFTRNLPHLMLKKILFRTAIVLAAVIAVLLAVIAMQPSEFRVTRSLTMSAPVTAVFPLVNELKKWEPWSPWARLDPNAKNSFDGPAAGVGSSMAWAGNNEVGEGKMTITESKPNELVRFRLDFYKPMAGTSDAEFTFKADGTSTTVTWTMNGKNDFIGRAVCLVMNMDTMIGGQFEKGLASIRAMVETPGKP